MIQQTGASWSVARWTYRLFVGILSSTSVQLSSTGTSEHLAVASGFSSAVAVAALIAAVGFVATLAYLRLLAGAKPARDAGAASTDAASASDAESIRSLMKTDVFTVPDTASVADALKLLVDKKISGAPIVDEQGSVCGFVSDGDIMRSLADQSPAFKSAWSIIAEAGNADFHATLAHTMALPVGEVATHKVVSIDVEASLDEACRVLADAHLKKAPVLENGKMIGIINRSNISRYAVNTYLSAHTTH